MYLGKVIGTVVSTSKDETLKGSKILVVARLDEKQAPTGETEIVVDSVGAGSGEIVIVSQGSAARFSKGRTNTVVDAAVVGIVDTVEIDGLA
ncbi:MAG: EutN/CcmL family microcompartment protein [Desulfovibrio sp.]|uniref:microcompartment shell vertex protein GrpN n=1 Tax=Desulfovibrio sp. 7SRBS1 TaxID=3378064 RepID=UPI003B41E624